MTDTLKNIGVRMREVRTNQGLTQSKMASTVGVADRTYKFYELERREIPLSVALRLCNEFSIELKWLATGQGPKAALGDFAIYECAAQATLCALENSAIKVSPHGIAKQISYVLEQSIAKGSSPTDEAESLISILAVSDKNSEASIESSELMQSQ